MPTYELISAIGTVVSLDFLDPSLCCPLMFFSGRKRVECGISFRMTGLLVIDLLIIWMQRLKGWTIEGLVDRRRGY
mgnify:CR=1 FL=1